MTGGEALSLRSDTLCPHTNHSGGCSSLTERFVCGPTNSNWAWAFLGRFRMTLSVETSEGSAQQTLPDHLRK